eukprot:Gb_06640 [translate_table: standard]
MVVAVVVMAVAEEVVAGMDAARLGALAAAGNMVAEVLALLAAAVVAEEVGADAHMGVALDNAAAAATAEAIERQPLKPSRDNRYVWTGSNTITK